MSNPKAVVISDIHFSLPNLELASTALELAITRSNELKVPLVIAGDLNDTKAIIRAEVANRLIKLLGEAKQDVFILVGNHDLINEKGIDNSLNFLGSYAHIMSFPIQYRGMWFIPYQSSAEKLKQLLPSITKGSILIMHQGFLGAAMGDYVQDKSSIDPELFKDYTVISGHYHRHQTIGTVTYIGSPYTITFGEANDGDKGFLILNEDGTFERIIIPLRKHVIFEHNFSEPLEYSPYIQPDDLLWVKARGPWSLLKKLKKADIGKALIGHTNFKLDLIPNDSKELEVKEADNLKEDQVLDLLIDQVDDTQEAKTYLKELWRSLL